MVVGTSRETRRLRSMPLLSVEELWTEEVPQGESTVNPGRLGRWVQCSRPRLEIPFTTSTGGPDPSHDHRLSLTSRSSKWNPIEDCLFSQISNNWAGRPLQSDETPLNNLHHQHLNWTRGCARMLPKKYEKGESFSDQQMRTNA